MLSHLPNVDASVGLVTIAAIFVGAIRVSQWSHNKQIQQLQQQNKQMKEQMTTDIEHLAETVKHLKDQQDIVCVNIKATDMELSNMNSQAKENGTALEDLSKRLKTLGGRIADFGNIEDIRCAIRDLISDVKVLGELHDDLETRCAKMADAFRETVEGKNAAEVNETKEVAMSD